MTYIIIHSNQAIAEQYILKTISKYLKENIQDLDSLRKDPNFFLIEPEESESIKIEQAKDLQKKIIYSPFSKKYQFGIILNAQLMTVEAQNSLLKTFEESHENTIFILTTNNEKGVLPTILSRCNRIYPEEKSEEKVKNEFVEEAAFLLKPVYEKISYIEEIVKEEKTNEFLDKLIDLFREKHSGKIREGKQTEKEEKLLKILTQAKYRIGKNVNKKIALEYVCFKLSEE